MTPRLHSSIVAFALCVTILGSHASAVTTLTAVADAYVELGNPDTNFGLSPNLTVKDSNTSGTTRKVYTRFDLTGINLATVIGASFDLTVAQRSAGGTNNSATQLDYAIEIRGLNNGNAGEFWVEGNGGTGNSPAGEIDWNNAPANAGGDAFNAAQTTVLGSYIIPGTANPGDVFTLSNAALLNFIKADTNGAVTLLVRRVNASGTNNLSFASAENTGLNGPLLNLTIIPEPATALLGLMGLAVLGRRRRVA